MGQARVQQGLALVRMGLGTLRLGSNGDIVVSDGRLQVVLSGRIRKVGLGIRDCRDMDSSVSICCLSDSKKLSPTCRCSEVPIRKLATALLGCSLKKSSSSNLPAMDEHHEEAPGYRWLTALTHLAFVVSCPP